MSTFIVKFLTEAGDLAERTVRAWHAAAAERTCCHLYGGDFHTAQEIHHA